MHLVQTYSPETMMSHIFLSRLIPLHPPCGILVQAPLTTSVKKRPRYISPPIIQGHMHEGLYRFSPDQKQSVPNGKSTVLTAELDSTSSMIPATELFELWHRRLGHPPSTVVNSVLKACNISVPSNKISRICTACQQGKSHKLPFSPSTTVYTCPFELLVSDLWGPAAINCGNSWSMVKTQFGRDIKQLQSDWGGEFRSFTSFLSQHGIVHCVTCPHTSEQNGVVERKHRHIVEVGLTSLVQAHLLLKFWGLDFTCAVHLINRLPTPVLHHQSPYSILYGTFPTYDHLRVFGCCCYPYLQPYNHHKLEFYSEPCMFLGDNSQHKGYQCLASNSRIFVSQHVVFDESRFLFPEKNLHVPSTTSHITTCFPLVQPRCSKSSNATPFHRPRPSSLSLSARALESPLTNHADEHQSSDNVTSSPTPIFPTTIVDPPPPLENTYLMVTRSKAGIFKPKVLVVELCKQEPRTIDDAFASPEWKKAAQDEYDTIIQNRTLSLVPLPPGQKAVGCK